MATLNILGTPAYVAKPPVAIRVDFPPQCARCKGYLDVVQPAKGTPFWKCERCGKVSDACYVLLSWR